MGYFSIFNFILENSFWLLLNDPTMFHFNLSPKAFSMTKNKRVIAKNTNLTVKFQNEMKISKKTPIAGI